MALSCTEYVFQITHYVMAEYGWALTKDMEEKAKRELNEFSESRHLAISAVKEQIETRPDISKL